MAETSSLLNCRTGHSVPGVRIPPPPQKNASEVAQGRFLRFYQIYVLRLWGSASESGFFWHPAPYCSPLAVEAKWLIYSLFWILLPEIFLGEDSINA